MGQTLRQRQGAGKQLAPQHDGLIAWSRADGNEFVCDLDQLNALLTSLSQAVTVTQKSANYTAVFTDAFTVIEFTHVSNTQILTMPTDAAQPLMGIGAVIGFQQIGAGPVVWPVGIVPGTPTVIGGVTYDVPVNLTIQRFVYYTWRKRAANEWILS